MRYHARFSWLVVLASTVIITFCTEPVHAQRQSRSRGKRSVDLPQLLDRLSRDKDAFEFKKKSAAQRVSASFNALIKDVQRIDDIDLAERAAILQELRDARDRFDKNQTLTPSPFMQGIYIQYIVAVRTGYYSLLERYDQVLHIMAAGDSQREAIEKDVARLTVEVNRIDMLQPGKTWRGFRSDFKPPPRLVPNGIWMRRWHLEQDKAVNVDFNFKVTKRRGNGFIGEVSQSGGGFIAEVEGKFDGVNLEMQMTRMIRGEPRQFEYSGQVVGSLGFLTMQGIKTDGNPTVGNIVIELKGN